MSQFPHSHIPLLLPLPRASVLCRPVPMAKPPRNLIFCPGSFLAQPVWVVAWCMGLLCTCPLATLSLSFSVSSLFLSVFLFHFLSLQKFGVSPEFLSWPDHGHQPQFVLMRICWEATFSSVLLRFHQSVSTDACLTHVVMSSCISLYLCLFSYLSSYCTISTWLALCQSSFCPAACFDCAHLAVSSC